MPPRPTRPHRANDEVHEEWDGVERRVYPPWMYQQFTPPPPEINNAAKSTLTLQQVTTMIVALGSILIGGFSIYNALSREQDAQKYNIEQIRATSVKDNLALFESMKEFKSLNNQQQVSLQKSIEALDRRVGDLDSTVSQLYQQMSTTKANSR